jgi:hypothetical protein
LKTINKRFIEIEIGSIFDVISPKIIITVIDLKSFGIGSATCVKVIFQQQRNAVPLLGFQLIASDPMRRQNAVSGEFLSRCSVIRLMCVPFFS